MKYLYFICLFGQIIILILSTVNGEVTDTVDNYFDHINDGQNPRSLISNIASNFIPKNGNGGSQIISLNLTNLLILLLLKALVFAAGHVGAGAWKGRSDDISNSSNNPYITESELLMYMGYLMGKPGNYSCLNLASCKDPKTATAYLNGAKLILNLFNIIDKENEADRTYSPVLTDIKKAIEYGKMENHNCQLQYKCSMITDN